MATDTAKLQIGAVRRLEPSEVWQHENDFTPWVLENIGAVCERLGLSVDPDACELGPFDTTVSGRDRTTGAAFLFETQIAPADQIHLGQLVAAASANDARLVAWIAPDFTPEHRQAIGWLNAVTHEGYRFLGVRIEILSIGDAFAIDVKVEPTDATVAPAAPEAPVAVEAPVEIHVEVLPEAPVEAPIEAPDESRDDEFVRRATWARFLEKLSSHDASVATIEVPNDEWLPLGDGYSAGLLAGGTAVEYEVTDIARYDGLAGQREAIEQAVGFELEWVRVEDGVSRISTFADGHWSADADGERALDWLLETISLFRNVFPLFQATSEDDAPATSGRRQRQSQPKAA